jgi:hypothetical protein
MSFKVWLESSINDLYDSAVEAYPRTEFRQHSVDTIKIVNLSIVPFKGMKTIFFRGLAQNEDREYNPIMVFKEVDYSKGIKLTASDGTIYELKPLLASENNVLARCNCADFRYRFRYYNYLDHSLYGNKGKKYEGGSYPVNPQELPGMCKHLMAMTRALRDSGILK